MFVLPQRSTTVTAYVIAVLFFSIVSFSIYKFSDYSPLLRLGLQDATGPGGRDGTLAPRPPQIALNLHDQLSTNATRDLHTVNNSSANTTAHVSRQLINETTFVSTGTFSTAPITTTSAGKNVRATTRETEPTNGRRNRPPTVTLTTRLTTATSVVGATTHETEPIHERHETITPLPISGRRETITPLTRGTRPGKNLHATTHKTHTRHMNSLTTTTSDTRSGSANIHVHKINTSLNLPVNSSPNHKQAVSPVITVPTDCKEPNCMEFLTTSEKDAIKACEKQVAKSMKGHEIKQSTCKFLQDKKRQPVALNSQEGSGNTWVRGLLERATGICTGFNWGCDEVLRAQGFLGEGIRSGRALVIKTHVRRPKWIGEVWKGQPLGYEPYYQSAVLILRHPALAMVADFNRQKSPTQLHDSHTHVLSPSLFGRLTMRQ